VRRERNLGEAPERGCGQRKEGRGPLNGKKKNAFAEQEEEWSVERGGRLSGAGGNASLTPNKESIICLSEAELIEGRPPRVDRKGFQGQGRRERITGRFSPI